MKYGKMVMCAVYYVFDDQETFQVFLTNEDVEFHNIVIDCYFRHIAMGGATRAKLALMGLPKIKPSSILCMKAAR